MEGAHCGPGLTPWRCSWQRLKKTVSPLGQLVISPEGPGQGVSERSVAAQGMAVQGDGVVSHTG